MRTGQLYIIGNGFDIFHGINSQYSDFKQYLLENDSTLHDLVEEFIPVEENWSDFESALAGIDVDNIVDTASEFLVSYGAEDWSDAFHHDYQYEIDEIITGLSVQVRLSFTNWINQLEIPTIANLSMPPLAISPTAKFLTFNYTSSIPDIYGVPNSSVCYIHGEAKKGQDLILGHAWNPVEIPSLDDHPEAEYMDTRVAEGIEIINSYFARTFKDTKRVIEENQVFFSRLSEFSTIYVLGHSLSDVDMDYFIEIAKNITIDMVDWIVTYYGNEERSHHKKTLLTLGIPENRIVFRQMNEL